MLVNLREGETPVFRLVPENSTKINCDQFLELVAKKAQSDIVQARYWFDAFASTLGTKLAENCAIDLGDLFAKLVVLGSLQSVGDKPTKEKNPVRARIYAKGALAEMLKAIEVINDTLTVSAVMYEVRQDNSTAASRIENNTDRVVINGHNILLNPSASDEGIWLENLDTGIKVSTALVSYSDGAVAYCTFPTLPATGKYRLVLSTRNGESADDYAVTRLTRNVFVVND